MSVGVSRRSPVITNPASSRSSRIEGFLHAGSHEDPAAKSLAFIQHSEEDGLRLDGAGPKLADFGASVEEDLKRS
jgi:hypothetical protein